MIYHKTRRNLLKNSAVVSAAVVGVPLLGRSAYANSSTPDDRPLTEDPRAKELVYAAIDSAVKSGASYADVRFTHTRQRLFNGAQVRPDNPNNPSLPGVQDIEEITVGVRSLYNGYWGYAAGPIWSKGEGARLGKDATSQAKINAAGGGSRKVSLAPNEVVKDGSWTMPIEIDPFNVHPSEISDRIMGILYYAFHKSLGAGTIQLVCGFRRQDKLFASSEGTQIRQRTYRAGGQGALEYRSRDGESMGGGLEGLTPSGVGYELLDEDKLRKNIDEWYEAAAKLVKLPVKPIDVGRYETVVDAASVAPILAHTLGYASELDRVLGFEANASGTSYINDPVEMLGKYKVGSDVISVTTSRSDKGGLATVKWDDEGVAASDAAIIDKGFLSGLETNRELAGWLSEETGKSHKSSGRAHSHVGIDAPIIMCANIKLLGSASNDGADDLIRDVKKGMYISGFQTHMDFQQLNGMMILGATYEINNGKIVAGIVGAGVLFRAPEFWKGVKALGGVDSSRSYGFDMGKGEPQQGGHHTVHSVPVRHESLAFINQNQKG